MQVVMTLLMISDADDVYSPHSSLMIGDNSILKMMIDDNDEKLLLLC